MSDGRELSGTIDDGVHRLFQRVYFEDTDFSGIVYHARYLHFLERGRTDYLRLLGIHHSSLDSDTDGERLAFAVRHMDLDFLKPARIDDVLAIETRADRFTGARMVMHQQIDCGPVALVRAKVTAVLINRQGKPKRLPVELRNLFGVQG
jgi:acyl-CoA thioester hydrolase